MFLVSALAASPAGLYLTAEERQTIAREASLRSHPSNTQHKELHWSAWNACAAPKQVLLETLEKDSCVCGTMGPFVR